MVIIDGIKYYTAEEYAIISRLSKRHIDRLCEQGKIKGLRWGTVANGFKNGAYLIPEHFIITK